MSSSSEEEVEEELTSTAILAGELDFPDVVCKLDGEVNENERRVQLGLAKFMAVDEDASARDVLSAMEATWGLDRPGALFTLAGGVTNLKIHTVLAQVCTRCCTPAPAAPAAPPMHLLCTSPASPVRHPCAGAHAGLRQGDARHACMGDLWRGRRWRHVDDRHRHPQGGVMLGLDLVRPDPEPGPRPAPPTLPTPTLPTHPPEISQPSLPPPSPLPSAAPAMPQCAQAGIWAPCIGVAPWGVLDEELQNGMQAAHDTGAAYEVPRRLSRDVDPLGEGSLRENSFSGRRGRATA